MVEEDLLAGYIQHMEPIGQVQLKTTKMYVEPVHTETREMKECRYRPA
jgi:hypothetical protein